MAPALKVRLATVVRIAPEPVELTIPPVLARDKVAPEARLKLAVPVKYPPLTLIFNVPLIVTAVFDVTIAEAEAKLNVPPLLTVSVGIVTLTLPTEAVPPELTVKVPLTVLAALNVSVAPLYTFSVPPIVVAALIVTAVATPVELLPITKLP